MPRWRELRGEVSKFIAWLEARAAEKAILIFVKKSTNVRVDIGIDNTNVLASLEAYKGSRNSLLNLRVRAILDIALRAGLVLKPYYVASAENPADAPSRFGIDRHDHRLSADLFHSLDEAWGWGVTPSFAGFSLDAMASTGNVQKHRSGKELPFYSRFEDEGSLGVNAFAQNLAKDQSGSPRNVYINPPFVLMLQTLALLREQQARATIIVPEWHGAAWWPLAVGQCVRMRLLAEAGSTSVFFRRTSSGLVSTGQVPFRTWAFLFDFSQSSKLKRRRL